jgi:hypothetical protein
LAQALDVARKMIVEAIADIDEERARLERALAELGGNKVAPRSPARRRGPKPGAKGDGRSGAPTKRRKRRGGGRSAQAVKLIEKSPGITAAEIAKKMKIQPNYLYRVLSDLAKEGRVKKEGRGYLPVS